MGKMKNLMTDVEDFCNGYLYGWASLALGDSEFTIDEVVEDVGMYFTMTQPGMGDVAKKYAEQYLIKTLGEI